MIRLQTEKGEVSISDAALSNITGAAATSVPVSPSGTGNTFKSLIAWKILLSPRCAIWSAKTPAQASAASTFASTA